MILSWWQYCINIVLSISDTTHANIMSSVNCIKVIFLLLQCSESSVPCKVQSPTLRSDGAGNYWNDAGWGGRWLGVVPGVNCSSCSCSSWPALLHLPLFIQRRPTWSLAGLHLQSWRRRTTGDVQICDFGWLVFNSLMSISPSDCWSVIRKGVWRDKSSPAISKVPRGT